MAKTRLGYLGPAIVLVGAVVAGLAIWFMQSVRPVAGTEIDRIAIDARRSFVLRNEASSDRSFLELRDGNEVKWQALIPHYAGRPGRPAIAWSEKAVTVRVERNGRAEVFVFSMDNAAKLGTFRLANEREPITMHAEGPITLTDNVRSYELVGGIDWHQLIAVDIVHGGGIWKVDLGRAPVSAAGVRGSEVWVEQTGKRRVFDSATGRETPDTKSLN